MQILRRRPVLASTKETVKAVTQQAFQRRLRTTSSHTAVTREIQKARAEDMIRQQLSLIAKANDAIDEATSTIDRANAEIERLMKLHNLSDVDDGYYEALLRETFTRQSRTIDPKKFKNQVPDAVFWGCVSVSIGKAEEHLSEKEINKITEVVPSKSNGYSLKVDKIQRTKPKRK